LPAGKTYDYKAIADDGYVIVGNTEGQIVVPSCNKHKAPPTCPQCESPKWEVIPEGKVGILVYSVGECSVCQNTQTLLVDTHARLEGNGQDFKAYYRGKTYHLTSYTGADGHMWYSIDIDFVGYNHDLVLLKPDAPDITSLIDFKEEWRLPRDLIDGQKFVVCSMAPSYADTTADGMAVWHPGHVVADWVTFLMNEGYFPSTRDGAKQAYDWVNQLRVEGKLALPAK
jgi:hypothetical protein